MSKYRVYETREFRARLDSLESRDSAFIRRKLDEYVYPQLREEPFFGRNIKKLRGYEPDTWRYRIGKFRVFYLVDPSEAVIYILTVDLRRDAYS
ncbi:MAG: mRNA interferase RelE/StbE [Rhodothermales bacterium]